MDVQARWMKQVKKLMLVDDDRTTLKLLQTLLELDGFRVVVVSEGARVLPLARAEAPDAVLMDVYLADADGLDLLKEIRSSDDLAGLPVIMSSGLEMEEECKIAGADGFILKPYAPDMLMKTIRTAMGE